MRKNNKKEMLHKIDKKVNTFLGKYTFIISLISYILYIICLYQTGKYFILYTTTRYDYSQYQRDIFFTYCHNWLIPTVIFFLVMVILAAYTDIRHITIHIFGDIYLISKPLF